MPLLSLLADPSPTPDEHRVRLHADAQTLGVHIHDESSYRDTGVTLALPGSALSLGFGFAPHPMVLVGTRLRGSLSAFRTDAAGYEHRTTFGSIGLLPYLEVRPLPRSRVQPFLAVEGGASYSGTKFRTSGYGRVTQQAITPSVGGRIGLHAFVLPRVSIDADVGVGRHWTGMLGRDASRSWWSAWTVTSTLGVSGWF